MKIQERINSTNLDMSEIQVKAFFLGVLCAEKPLPFQKAFIELLSETPEAKSELEVPFQSLWDQLSKNLKSELEQMFPEEEDVNTFMELAKDQLDFFLTGLSLSGTNSENCKDQALAEFIEELEDTVEDMDDFTSDAEASGEDGHDFKKFLLDIWKEFTSSKQ